MKNQDGIGAAVTSFYGKAAGDKLTVLLKEHISIAVDLIKFAKAGDKPELAGVRQSLGPHTRDGGRHRRAVPGEVRGHVRPDGSMGRPTYFYVVSGFSRTLVVRLKVDTTQMHNTP
jgi:hypothetical protein